MYGLKSSQLKALTVEMPEVKESLLQTVSYRLKQNLLAIPFFAQLKKILETKKTFKMLGAVRAGKGGVAKSDLLEERSDEALRIQRLLVAVTFSWLSLSRLCRFLVANTVLTVS